MKNKLRDVMETLDFDELIKMKDDMENGGVHLKNLVDKEIKKNEQMHEQYCSVCSNSIHPEDINNFTLVFGPESFRKKATFCAIDCLQYFLENLKKVRNTQDCISIKEKCEQKATNQI